MSDITLAVNGVSPSTPSVNQVVIYSKAEDKRLYIKDDSGSEVKLVTDETTISDLTVQLPLTSSGGPSPTLAINTVSTTEDGAMLYEDKLLLDNKTYEATSNTLVYRDSLGNAMFNKVIASEFEGSLKVTNDDVLDGANISLSKLELNPLDRLNHTGTQLAASISDFNQAVYSNEAISTTVSQSSSLVPSSPVYNFVDAVNSSITIVLPSAVNSRKFVFKKIDSSTNLITIQGINSQLIEGTSTFTLSDTNQVVTLVSDGSSRWFVV